MTPLTLLAASRRRDVVRRELHRGATVLVARPRGVLHAYTGSLTPSGRSVPRAGRTACHAHTRTLTVVPLAAVGTRRVCLRCTARLTQLGCGEAGHPQTRDQVLASYDGVTAFDLAVDAWRAETLDDVERLEWLALLIVGYPACSSEPVVAPSGKTNPPLDVLIARARTRLGGTRDPLAWTRASVAADEENTRAAAKTRRGENWRDREARIERLGYVNATRTA